MNGREICVVTGATGFVGSHLADYLSGKGYRVKVICRKGSNLRWVDQERVEIFDAGLFDIEKLSEIFEGATYIYHVAGVVKSKTEDGYFTGNVKVTENVLRAALKCTDTLKKIVVVSSQAAVGPSPTQEPINETYPNNPLTTYGRSKYEQEKVCKEYFDRLPITICRASAVYGERDTEIFIFFNTFSKGLMTKVGFDNKKLNLIHVTDLVDGLYRAAVSERSRGEIYFLASEETYSWDEVREVCVKVFNKKPISVCVPHFIVYLIAAIAEFFALFSSQAPTLNIEKARDLTRRYWTCSVDKAKGQLGFRQKLSLYEGISKTIDWYRKNKWL